MKALLLCWFAGSLTVSAAALKFDEMTKEIRAGADARTVTTEFNFKNETAEDVIIDRYDAACTCINAQIKGGKLVYKPGESGVIRAAFDMSLFSGTVDKSVAVWLKGDPESKPSITLTTRVIIPVLVEVEPKTLIWQVGDKAEPKTVTLTMNHSEPIRVTAVSGADARFKQELKVIEEGKKYEVVVTPASTDKVGMGVIHIETDCSVQRHRSQRIFTVVRHPLSKPPEAVAKP
jgi:hypothetical protein